MLLPIFSLLYAFVSNSDVSDGLVFGKEIGIWMIYTLIFFAITSIAFLWVWISGFLKDIQQGRSINKPWD